MFSPAFLLARLRLALVLTLGLLAATCPPAFAQLSAPVPAVDTSDRAAVLDLYHTDYLPGVGVPSGWTGSLITGDPGTVSDAFLQATLRRINYFRSMCGLNADITFDAAANAKCQQAALMMAAEQNISHTPPSSWPFYTADAAAACAASNIRLDWKADEGALAIDKFIADDESNNTYVGHRRWLLFAGEQVMASGSIPANRKRSPGTNATWVASVTPRPANAPAATSWPPAGFVPAPLVFRRWSFSYLYADFSAATVAVTKNGVPISVTPETTEYQTFAGSVGIMEGDNTFVWELPDNLVSATDDETYEVTVGNVFLAGAPRQFTYTVTTLNPNVPRVSVTPSKPFAYQGGKRGGLLVSRTGDLSGPLTVSYAVGGTAQPGVAYKALPGTLTIPAGASSAKLKVVPVDTAPADTVGTTVVVTVQDGGSAYTAATPNTGTVTIEQQP